MSDFKIAITDCDHSNIQIEESILKNAGLDFKLFQCKTEDDVINECRGINAFINQYAPVTDKVMQALPDLKFIVRYGVGVNNIDLEAASNYGIQVCNVPDYGMNEVAEQALAMMLALTRKIVLNNSLVRQGVWDYTKSIPIFRHSEQTVGIVGVGRIGQAFAKRVNALGCKIIACDIRSIDAPNYINMVSFDEVVRTSDIISIHCPADNNIDLFNEKIFNKMKKNTYLINVSRGGIINENALFDALENKKIAGAALDVSVKEPIDKKSALLKFDNFIISPHLAWYSEESALELKKKVAQETVRFAKGEHVHYPVNKIS